MNGDVRGNGAESEWAFYWAPWWKGALWLGIYLVGGVVYRQLAMSLTRGGTQEFGTGIWFLFYLGNPMIWISASLCWLSMKKKNWQCVGEDANSRRIAFLKTYVPEAASLITIMALIIITEGLYRLLPRYGVSYMGRGVTTAMRLFFNNALAGLDRAVMIGLSVPMFTYLAVTRLPSGRRGIAGVIVPGLLIMGMFHLTNSIGRLWLGPFMTRLKLPDFSNTVLSISIHYLLIVTLIGGLGFFLVREVNVNVFARRE